MTYREQPGEEYPAGAAPDPATAREEAERLVAAGLAAVSMAADRIGAPSRERGGAAAAGYDVLGDVLFGPPRHRHSVANDSVACCQCPVCKVISAARQPSPVFAERLATGVGTLAEGAVRVLRTVAGPAEPARSDTARSDTAGPGTAGPGTARPAADRSAEPAAPDESGPPGGPGRPDESGAPEEPDPWAAATAAATGTGSAAA